MSDILLDIQITQNLRTAGGPVLMQIDLGVFKSELLAITGPSGAGKTTLLRQIAGLIKPDSGRIVYSGNLWFDKTQQINLQPQKRNTGFVFQDYALFPHLTVLENLKFALDGKSTDRIDELLNVVELTELADRKPFQLSGGQQQRVALARALVRQPELLLLDEPLAALDTFMRKKLQDYLRSLRQRFDFTVILVTHDQGEIFGLANRVAVIEQGKIVKIGTPHDVLLPKPQPDDKISVYGEIVRIEPFDDHILVQILVGQNIRTLKLPVEKLDELAPGRGFVIHYSVENPDIELLN